MKFLSIATIFAASALLLAGCKDNKVMEGNTAADVKIEETLGAPQAEAAVVVQEEAPVVVQEETAAGSVEEIILAPETETTEIIINESVNQEEAPQTLEAAPETTAVM